MQAPYPNPCTEMLLSFRHYRSQWLQQSCFWEGNWAPVTLAREVQPSSCLKADLILFLAEICSTDLKKFPLIEVLLHTWVHTSSSPSLCRSLLPFYFQGTLFYRWQMTQWEAPSLFPCSGGAGGCHSSKPLILQLFALSLLLSSHFPIFIHFPQNVEPKPMGLSLPGYTSVDMFLSQCTTPPTQSCSRFRFSALPPCCQPTLWKSIHNSLRIHLPLLLLS